MGGVRLSLVSIICFLNVSSSVNAGFSKAYAEIKINVSR
jgi:hypothetical protein